MATLYLDLESGSDAADGTSFANRKKTLAGASAIAQPGDTVRIMASTTPNSLGVDGTFARGSTKITLASAVSQSIDEGEAAWTASANVTCTTSSTRKQGLASVSIAIAGAFGTGIAAYKAFSATDFSAYQQISFWLCATASGFTGSLEIKLCSDSAGAVAVDTFTIPMPVLAGGAAWNRVTINKGSSLGASIQSVALYVVTDVGTTTVLLDNIIACKAPGTGELSHKTLIGKANSLGAGGDDSETWYAIRAIEGTTITLDLLNSSNAGSTTNGRYWGTSETVTAYSLFPSYVPTNVVSADLQWTAGGTDQATLTISGGWNRTDMTTQTGQTFIALGNQPSATTSVIIQASYISVSKVNWLGFLNGVTVNGASNTLTMQGVNISAFIIGGTSCTLALVTANTSAGQNINGIGHTVTLLNLSDQSAGLSLSSATACAITFTAGSVSGNISPAVGNTITFNGVTYGSFGEASIADAVRTELTSELATVTKLDDTLEDDAGTYRFTTNALEQAPSGGGGGGGDATAANQALILAAIADVPTNVELSAALASADDATLAAIAALNNLSAAQVNTQCASAISSAALATAANLATVAGYLDTEIAAIQAKTDNLPSDPADASVIAGLIAAIPAAPTAAANASATRTELATELARIDAAISSRSTYAGADTSGTTTLLARVPAAVMLASSYSTPPSAAANASATRTELATELARVDVATSTRLATAGYTAAPTAAQNRAEMDSNSTKLAAIVADTNELQTDWANDGRLDLILDTAAGIIGGDITLAEFGASALAQLAALDTINVRGTQVRNGVIDSLVIGRDYLTADGQQLQFVNAAGSWPNLAGATITLRLSSLTNDPVVIAGSVVTASGLNQRADVSFSSAVTDALSSDYRVYTLEAVLSTGNSVRLETGTVIVTE